MSPDRACICANCGMAWRQSQLRPLAQIQDLCCRLDEGSEVPAGECGACGCFAYYDRGARHVPLGSVAELRRALEIAVDLNKHYAKLLNMYDSGARRGYSADAWIQRLRETGELKDDGAGQAGCADQGSQAGAEAP